MSKESSSSSSNPKHGKRLVSNVGMNLGKAVSMDWSKETKRQWKDINYGEELLTIHYDIWISGTKLSLSKKKYITNIEVKETVEGADYAVIEIQDPKMSFINDNLFLEDNTIKIVMKWSSSTYRTTFNGFISLIEINFNSDGIPHLNITCMDNTHKMNRKTKNRKFEKCTSESVVKKIVKEYGFKCVTESGYKYKVQDSITQSDQTDADFLTKLAGDEVYPFTARLVGDTFRYEKMGHLTTPKMTLTYRDFPHEIISFTPRINKEIKKVEVQSSSIKTENKQMDTTKSLVGNTSSSDNGSSSSSSKSTPPSSGSAKSKDTLTSSSSLYHTYDPDSSNWNNVSK